MPIKDLEARREYNRKWLASRRAEWFDGKSCASCGSAENLELDHIDPSQKVTHNVWSWSAARREVELSKCQPLCRGCHSDKTRAQFLVDHEHGTRGRYDKGCRCGGCVGAHSAAVARWRSSLR